MCFSAEASFTAAAALSVTGAASLYLVRKHPSLFLIALIPLLFGVQQASEGLVWLQLEHVSEIGKYLFLIFAYLIWPVWIPLALWTAEKIDWRKNLIGLCLIFGICWSLYHIYTLGFMTPSVEIVKNSIHYSTSYHSPRVKQVLTLAYMTILIAPCFLSSIPNIWFFGLFAIFSAGVTNHFYHNSFASVWCFFAALASLLLYFILKRHLQKT